MEDSIGNYEPISFLWEHIKFLSIFATISEKQFLKFMTVFFPKYHVYHYIGQNCWPTVNSADEEEISIGGLSSRATLSIWNH